MSAPLYFFPTVRLADLVAQQGLNRELLARYDLAASLGDLKPGQMSRLEIATAAGPGDKSGAMLSVNTAGEAPLRFGYYPQFQEWLRVRAEPELWLGLDREHRPGPADLARPNLLDGHPVTLADGQTYRVPILRSPDPSRVGVPREMYFDDCGQFTVALCRDYQALWEIAGQVWDFLVPTDAEAAEQTLSFETILGWCLAILGANYRYGRAEHALLRLVNTGRETWEAIFNAAADMPFIAETVGAAKKNESPAPPAGASTPPGAAACAPSTAPAAASSI